MAVPNKIEPAPDVRIANHGSVVLLHPQSPTGQAWLDENIGADALTFGRAIVCEPRYVSDILTGMVADGLVVE